MEADKIIGMVREINEYFRDSGRIIHITVEKHVDSGKWSYSLYDTMMGDTPYWGETFSSSHDMVTFLLGFRQALHAVKEADGE